MKHKPFTLICLVAMILAGCTGVPNTDLHRVESTEDLKASNPFAEDSGVDILGSLSHGFVNKEVDENNQRLPIVYDGGEIEIEYSVKASGKAKNVGFLIFVDGEAQMYKTDRTSEYSNMCTMDLLEDDVAENITFIFTPSTGKKDETLNLYIVSIYNPEFMPDMVNTSSYGMYHNELTSYQKIIFNGDAPQNTEHSVDLLQDSLVLSEYMTDDFIKKIQSTTMFAITDEQLNNRVNSIVFYNGEEVLSGNIGYDNEVISINYLLFGVPTARYKTTFFLNHQAVSNSYETILEKGKISIISFNIDPSILNGNDTFYAVSVPSNEYDFKDEYVSVEKSSSMLFTATPR